MAFPRLWRDNCILPSFLLSVGSLWTLSPRPPFASLGQTPLLLRAGAVALHPEGLGLSGMFASEFGVSLVWLPPLPPRVGHLLSLLVAGRRLVFQADLFRKTVFFLSFWGWEENFKTMDSLPKTLAVNVLRFHLCFTNEFWELVFFSGLASCLCFCDSPF